MTEPTRVGDLVDAVVDMAVDQIARAERPSVMGKSVDQILAETRDAPGLLVRPPADVAGERAAARAAVWRDRIPVRFHDATTDDLDDQAGGALRGWALEDDGSNALIIGPVGTGKTHAAVAAARVFYDRGDTVEFWPMVELLDAFRPNGRLADVDLGIKRARLLILDDLGAERPSDWTVERLYGLINRRWLDQQPIIVTSNIKDGPALAREIGERLYSRLAHDALAIRMSGDDHRRRT